MKDWSKINKHSIVQDRVLLKEFSNDYQELFNTKLNIGCGKCIDEAYKRIISLKNNNMKKTCNYRLKLKYEGTFFKGSLIRNGDLTDEIAGKLLKEHPHGEQLFDITPNASELNVVLADETETLDSLMKMSRTDLDAKAEFHSLDSSEYKNKTEISQAILEAINDDTSSEEEE